MKKPSPDTPRKIAALDKEKAVNIFVKGLNWVGDAIMATPALGHLRRTWPDSRITLMVRPWVGAIYEHNPDINQLWVHDESASARAFFKAIKMVQQGRFTLGVALPNSFRAAALLQFGGVRRRVGYRRAGRGWMLNYGVDLKPEYLEEHQIFYYLRLIEPLCGKAPLPVHLVLKSGELEREEVRRLLAQRGLDRGQPLVGLAPGSINSDAKRWPAERYAALADRLHRQAQAEVLLLGSAQESDVLGRVATQCQAPVHNLGGSLGLAQLIALVERLAGMICNDSGAMHIAAALGIPTVAIFGPTHWATTYPFSPRSRITRREVDCAPCMLRECPTDHRCMMRIEVEEVFEDFKRVVKEGGKQKSGVRIH